MRIYCKCGCRCKVNPGREYIWGHNRIGATYDNPRKGRTNEEYIGVEKAREISLKLSLASKGRLDPRKGLTNEEYYGAERAEEIKERASLVRIGKKHPMFLEGKENCRRAAVRRWKDPEYILKQRIGRQIKPNKSETYLGKLIESVCPGEWAFVGDWQLVIGGKCPDFANINGRKQLIELYGDYWHRGQNPENRVKLFKQYGFDCLIIWESELYDSRNKLKDKIISFVRGETYG